VRTTEYAYARVSTTHQDLERQLDALAKAGVDPKRIYSDKKSGATTDRPGLVDIFDRLREGDVLVVYTLDRLGRTVRDVLNQIHGLRQAGIGLRTLADAIPIDTSKPGDAMSELAMVLLSLFAQMERTYAVERAAHARAVREEKGLRTGRKIASNTEQHLEWARHLRDIDHLTMTEITAKTGIPRTSLYRHFLRMDDRSASTGHRAEAR
jgi:DNA invertase Pin-like site-specific DNA recombinase